MEGSSRVKILHVNKFAYSKGGAEEYMLRLASAQRKAGNEVWVFGSLGKESGDADPATIDYPVIDFHAAHGVEKLSAVREVLWSRRAARSIRDVLADVKPDVVHVHNYAHQLSSSIFPAISASGALSVHTAHDYKLICPAYVATRRGHDCFNCSRRIDPRLLIDRCHHGSTAWSALVAAESTLNRALRILPDKIIAPSQFMFDRLADGWIDDSRLRMVRNPANSSGLTWVGGGPLLYVGRLSREKGIERLIRATVEAGLSLDVAGDGPLREELTAIANAEQVRFHGHIDQSDLADLRSRTTAQVVPSDWPENAPLSVLECVVDGVPVVATRRGGLPEFEDMGARIALVDEITADSLTAAVAQIEARPGDSGGLRVDLSWENHVSLLDAIYGGAA